MWKHVYKVSYFSLFYTGDGVTWRFICQGSSELLPLLFSFGPCRVSSLQSYSLFSGLGIECWLGLVSSGFLMIPGYRINVFSASCLPPDTTGVQTQFSKLRGYSIIMEKYLLHLNLSDLVTSGGFARAFLTGGSLPYLFFLMAQRS